MINFCVHSCYDLLNSTIKYEEVFAKVQNNDEKTLVLVDPNFYGVIKAHKIAKKYNVKVIYGLEVKVAYGMKLLTLNILCKNNSMFQKMYELSTFIQEHSEITLETFVEKLIGCEQGAVIVVAEQLEDSIEFNYLADVFRNFEFYFGFNETYNFSAYQYYNNVVYLRASYYLHRHNYQQVVVTRAIRDNKKLNIADLTTYMGEDFVRSSEDFRTLLSDASEEQREFFMKIFSNQQKIVAACNCNLEFNNYHLPKYIYSAEESLYAKMTSREYLHYLVLKGVKTKLGGKDIYKYKKRYEYELKIIHEMGFDDYFLIVQDFVKYAKSNGILVGAGRGSAAGSLVCYLLDITEADPLEYNLLFERFLNKERITMPDIDIDFQDTRRDEVIKYVEKKYGSDNVAQIMTFTTFQSKSAARETARILQFSEDELKFISSNISSTRTLNECYKENSNLREFVAKSEKNKRWFSIALSLENIPKNPSIHAAGIVISDNKTLVNYTPLSQANLTKYITQWTMDDLEYSGLLKIDFLGIRYLTMLANIAREIQKTNKDFDLAKITYDDKKVYNLFALGKTEGIFQFESSGMKEKLRLLKPTEFNDIVAMNALYRPGPMAQIENYVLRKNGVQKVEYPHKKLEKILKDTYGILVYQEQIMLIAVNFAGMTLNEADNMRRAVSKKKKEDLEYYGKIFIEKSVNAGYDFKTATEIFNLIVAFANYGFNKSHAVVYSMLAYKLAYLKVYYTKYFMTALLNNVINSEKKINEYKQELNNLGIELVKPDINTSLREFSVYKNQIVFALLAIKNVGYRGAQVIVEDRLNFGKYQSIDDFLKRMDKKVDYQASISLVKAGAFDSFGYNRATIMKKVKEYYEDNRQYISNVRNALAESGLTLKTEEVEEYEISELIKMEKEVTGTYFLKHPVQIEKEKYAYLPLKYIGSDTSDSIVEVITKKEIKTKKGDYMAFLTVNDGKNDYDVTVFPSVYKFANVFLKVGESCVVTLKKQIRTEKEQYILEKIATLKNYNEYCLNNIKVIYTVLDKEIMEFIKNYQVAKSGVKLVCFSDSNATKAMTIYIKDARQFIEQFLEQFPKKLVRINYQND